LVLLPGSVTEDRRVAFSDGRIDGFVGVAVNPSFFFVGNFRVGEYGINGTLWGAGTAIDALIGVNDEVGVEFAEGFNGANRDAFLILVVHASRGHDVRHALLLRLGGYE
tara:strand:+ start:1043 stop:1369 length:327 start_codon:yes stop_codon:yes gene_type:complete